LTNKLEFFLLKDRNKYSFYNKGRYVINDLYQVDKLLKFKPHLVIIYNNSNYINPELIYKIQNVHKVKFLFYLMDMEPLSGGCHYNFDCIGYQKKCDKCPAVKTVIHQLPKKNLKIKKQYIGNSKVTFISPNKKVLNSVYKSSIYNNKLHKNILLYLGLDLGFYKPMNKSNKKVVFAFRSSLNPHKGQVHIIKSLQYIVDHYSEYINKIKFNVVGDRSIRDFLEKKGFKYNFKNSIKSEKSLVNFYQSSDFFINQTIQDFGPFMVNESLACGVPVISFKEGVSVDLIKNGYNGFLISNFSSVNLAKNIISILQMKKSKIKKIKNNSRDTAKNFLNFKDQIKKILI
jgi:glycosyltransferase involved in cell wall biosynthesis